MDFPKNAAYNMRIIDLIIVCLAIVCFIYFYTQRQTPQQFMKLIRDDHGRAFQV